MNKYNFGSIGIGVFYLLILNIGMFIVLSSFGQTFLFGTNLSFIFPLFCFLIYLFIFQRIPISINIIYLILIFYTIAITLVGKDFYHWVIAIFTLSSISLFGIINIKEKEFHLMFTMSGLFS